MKQSNGSGMASGYVASDCRNQPIKSWQAAFESVSCVGRVEVDKKRSLFYRVKI